MKKQTIWQVLFSAKGRVNRQKLILVTLAYSVFIMFLLVMSGIFGSMAMEEEGLSFSAFMSVVIGILTFVSYIPFVWSSIVLQIKRWHDLDKSGWFVLLGFVPVVNLICMVFLLFIKGTDGTNQFGPDPLA